MEEITLKVSPDDAPIYRELVERWNERHGVGKSQKVEKSNTWRSRFYTFVTDWLKGPKIDQVSNKLASYQAIHRSRAYV